MKRYYTFALLALTLSLCLNASGATGKFRRAKISKEEYAVYSAVISHLFAGGKVTFDTQSKIKLLVIKDHTINSSLRASQVEYRNWEYLKQFFPEASPEMINDFAAKNKQAGRLKDDFKVELKRTVIKKDELERMFKDGSRDWDKSLKDWENFYKVFPDSGGYIAFSRVGFAAGKKQALAYMEHNCGLLCASGQFILLKKSKTGWEAVKQFMPWIS